MEFWYGTKDQAISTEDVRRYVDSTRSKGPTIVSQDGRTAYTTYFDAAGCDNVGWGIDCA